MNKPKSEWIEALRESNALGWLVLAVLIAVVVLGALILGRGPSKSLTADIPISESAR